METKTKAKTILIVEDDVDVMGLYEIGLKEEGFKVITSFTVYDSIKKSLYEKIDLVIMDLLLHGVGEPNGIVASLAMRKMGYNGPILVITGGLLPIDELIYAAAEITDKLVKPKLVREIVEKINGILKRG